MFLSNKVKGYLLCSMSLALMSMRSTSAVGQVQATLRAATEIPSGQSVAPTVPGGAVVIGNNIWIGDGFDGFRHMMPAVASTNNLINAGILIPDPLIQNSLFGGAECFIFCKVGQVASDGGANIFFASYDQQKGNGITFPGIWHVQADPTDPQAGAELFSAEQLVPKAGLAGNLTTAVAYGPDGNLYVGFLKNGNIKRIVNPLLTAGDPQQVVQSVGSSPNGRNVRALVFVGNDLYIADQDSLSVIKDAIAAKCQGGCNAVAVADGFNGVEHVGLTTDGVDRLYMSLKGQVWRYSISTEARALVANSGLEPNGLVLPFAFVGGHTNLLQLDSQGNLWIGDDPSDGAANFQGRLWSISAAELASIP
jgi:hypothetical protein